MWTYTLDGPGLIRRTEQPATAVPLAEGQIRLRFLAGGLCGSDMPRFRGVEPLTGGGIHRNAPIHEIVGEVIESRSTKFSVGQRVLGTGAGADGLSEILIESDATFIPAPDALSDVEAVSVQSIATVIRAVDQLAEIAGRSVAVIGVGPIGLAFIHVLRHRGARYITAVDPVQREEVALRFGADEFVNSQSSTWLANLSDRGRPEVVIDAAGHQNSIVRDALLAVADRGFVYGFGAPDADDYELPYRELYERGLTLMSGRTVEGWVEVLNSGRDYLLAHRSDFAGYVSHSIPVENAQDAYTLYAEPQVGRLKVVLR